MRCPSFGAVFALVVMALAILAVPASAYSGGITGRTESGCTCHAGSKSPSLEPEIEGLPGSYLLGETYELVIRYTGAPFGSGSAIAGFNLAVEAGELYVPEGTTTIRVDSSAREATHTSSGAMNNVWTVFWRAPEKPKGDVDVVLVVNAVNGDGSAGNEDQWGRVEYTVDGESAPLTYVLVFAAVLAPVVIATLVILRNRRKAKGPAPRPPERSGKQRRRSGSR